MTTNPLLHLSESDDEDVEPDENEYTACRTPGRRGCGECDACADWLHFAEGDR